MASGSRVNRAADDAAGLAIAEKMRGSIRSMKADIRNAQDGISMIQTAEGAMNEISAQIIRLRELSIQSASDTMSFLERGFIDREVQQIKAEIDRIAGATDFNGLKMLDAGNRQLDVQVGLNSDEQDRQKIDLSATHLNTTTLGIANASTATREAARTSLDAMPKALDQLTLARASLGALHNRMQSSVNNMLIYHDNLSSSRSQIKDADLAHEASEEARQGILTQAATSVSAQANHSAELVTKLL